MKTILTISALVLTFATACGGASESEQSTQRERTCKHELCDFARYQVMCSTECCVDIDACQADATCRQSLNDYSMCRLQSGTPCVSPVACLAECEVLP